MYKASLMRILPAIILLFIVFSCSDDKEAGIKNTIAAEKDSDTWAGRTEMNLNAVPDTLVILGIAKEEVLVMKIRFNGIGTYPLLKNQAIYYTTVGGDVLTSEYKSDAGNHVGELIITGYDENNKVIQGTFQINLKKVWSNPENNITAVTFSKGLFNGKVKEY
jgi:hypothetical protein